MIQGKFQRQFDDLKSNIDKNKQSVQTIETNLIQAVDKNISSEY